MITGMGIWKISPVAKNRNDGENPEMGLPFEYNRAAPRATLIIPRVEIKGGSLPNVIKRPFTKPQPSPTANPLIMAIGMGSPVCKTLASTTPEKAKIDPTERSIPAVMITKVIPTAMIALIAVCWAIFSKIEIVKKYGVRIHSTTTSTINPNNVPNCLP